MTKIQNEVEIFNYQNKELEYIKDIKNTIQNLSKEINILNLKLNNKEDDIKNILNENDIIIKEMNNKLSAQQKFIIENKNEISNLNKKINELSNNFTIELKERDNKLNTLDEKILDIKNKNVEIMKENENKINIINQDINKKFNDIVDKINKEKDYILNEINSKYNELTEKNKYINDNLKLKIRQQFKQLLIYNEYEKKIEYKFIKDPKNLKYNKDIAHENTKFGYNDIFEIYISIKDSKEYLASANYTNYNIEIYALDNSIIYPLKGHQNDIRTVRYFLDKRDLDDNFNEYLISADDSKIVIVWDIINNYNIKCKIDTKYGNCIFSCLLVFPFNINDSYIILLQMIAPKIMINRQQKFIL